MYAYFGQLDLEDAVRNEYRRDDAMGQTKKPRNHLCKWGIVASALPMRPVSLRQTLKNA